MENKVVFPRML